MCLYGCALQAAWLAEAQALRAHYCADDAGGWMLIRSKPRSVELPWSVGSAVLFDWAWLVHGTSQLPLSHAFHCRPAGPAAGCRRLAGGPHAAVRPCGTALGAGGCAAGQLEAGIGMRWRAAILYQPMRPRGLWPDTDAQGCPPGTPLPAGQLPTHASNSDCCCRRAGPPGRSAGPAGAARRGCECGGRRGRLGGGRWRLFGLPLPQGGDQQG